jgi:hypothetical protein
MSRPFSLATRRLPFVPFVPSRSPRSPCSPSLSPAPPGPPNRSSTAPTPAPRASTRALGQQQHGQRHAPDLPGPAAFQARQHRAAARAGQRVDDVGRRQGVRFRVAPGRALPPHGLSSRRRVPSTPTTCCSPSAASSTPAPLQQGAADALRLPGKPGPGAADRGHRAPGRAARVRFRLRKANVSFASYMALAFAGIQSAEYAAQLLREGRPQALNNRPVGTGPYQLPQLREGRRAAPRGQPRQLGRAAAHAPADLRHRPRAQCARAEAAGRRVPPHQPTARRRRGHRGAPARCGAAAPRSRRSTSPTWPST